MRGFVLDMDGTLVLGDRNNKGLRPLPGAQQLFAALTERLWAALPWLSTTAALRSRGPLALLTYAYAF